MVVGEAARQVDPLTGGKIINTMAAGQLAALTAVEAAAGGDSSRRSWAAMKLPAADRGGE